MKGLLKCPFCGERQDIRVVLCGASGSSQAYAVMCDWCGSRGGRMLTPAEAKQVWNTREGEDGL